MANPWRVVCLTLLSMGGIVLLIGGSNWIHGSDYVQRTLYNTTPVSPPTIRELLAADDGDIFLTLANMKTRLKTVKQIRERTHETFDRSLRGVYSDWPMWILPEFIRMGYVHDDFISETESQSKELDSFVNKTRKLETLAETGLQQIADRIANAKSAFDPVLGWFYLVPFLRNSDDKRQVEMLCDHAESTVAAVVDMYHSVIRIDKNLLSMNYYLTSLKQRAYLMANSTGSRTWRAHVLNVTEHDKCLATNRPLHECGTKVQINEFLYMANELDYGIEVVEEYYQRNGNIKKDLVLTCKRFQAFQLNRKSMCLITLACPMLEEDRNVYVGSNNIPPKRVIILMTAWTAWLFRRGRGPALDWL